MLYRHSQARKELVEELFKQVKLIGTLSTFRLSNVSIRISSFNAFIAFIKSQLALVTLTRLDNTCGSE